MPRKYSLSKKIELEYNIFPSWKDDNFFRKKWYFFFGRKMKDQLSQEIHGDMIFFVHMYKCYKYDNSPKKIHLKIHLHLIDILDRILERFPTILWMETLIDVFIYCFAVKKKQDTEYIELKFDLFFNLFGWRYSTMKNLQYSVPFSPQEFYLEVYLITNEGGYFSIRRWVINPKI